MTTPTATVGASKILKANFTDSASPPVAADPTTVTLNVRAPDGSVTTLSSADSPATLTNDVVGEWRHIYAVTLPGRHFLHWDGDTAIEAAVQQEFYALSEVAT